MKILKNSKALSPVVASIILIAVTVAVSIAVAAWMGALSFNFMSTEQLTFTNSVMTKTNATFTVRNSGSSDLSIQEVRVDGNNATITIITGSTTLPRPLVKGELVTIFVDRASNAWIPGVQYEFTVITAKGNTFGPLIKTAP
jgi:flagellin-like protein